MTASQHTDINKYIGIGRVDDEPKIKFVSKTNSYLIEFSLAVNIVDPAIPNAPATQVVHPVVVRNERLALYLKDILSQSARIYLEGQLIPFTDKTLKTNQAATVRYRIEANEIELIDKPERPTYPEDIKKIR